MNQKLIHEKIILPNFTSKKCVSSSTLLIIGYGFWGIQGYVFG